MNYDLLKPEVLGDPIGRGYGTMSDAEVATSLNTVDQSIPRQSMSASEIFNALDMTEFNALSNADEAKVWDILGIGELNPFGNEASQMTAIFGAGSTSITALKALRVENISRAAERGLATVSTQHITNVRAM